MENIFHLKQKYLTSILFTAVMDIISWTRILICLYGFVQFFWMTVVPTRDALMSSVPTRAWFVLSFSSVFSRFSDVTRKSRMTRHLETRPRLKTNTNLLWCRNLKGISAVATFQATILSNKTIQPITSFASATMAGVYFTKALIESPILSMGVCHCKKILQICN